MKSAAPANNVRTLVTGKCDLEIIELSATEWRVSDPSIPAGDPTAILGVIEQVGTVFEVTRLDRFRDRSYASSFRGAAEKLTPRRQAWPVAA